MKHRINDNGIERDMTLEEIANYEAVIATAEADKAAIQAKAQAVASARTKLAALGLTDDEIAALVG
jgi:hypothetical protein